VGVQSKGLEGGVLIRQRLIGVRGLDTAAIFQLFSKKYTFLGIV